MKRGGSFLAGATGRLLPMSVPFRYFGAAVVFHLLAWLALLAGAPRLPRFLGGLDWPLAALHLVTLGVLVMTALGASLQLLPVATRQPVRATRAPAAIWALYTPGVAAVALGMGLGQPWLLGAGAVAVALALLGWAALLAVNLRHARGMPGVVAHGWAALGALLVMLLSALALAALYLGLPLLDRATALALHVVFAAYGFMGLLALGFSYILVPMFALSATPDERLAIASCGLAVAALSLAAAAAFGIAPLPLRLAALALGASAVALHLRVMLAALRTGLRRELGRILHAGARRLGLPRGEPAAGRRGGARAADARPAHAVDAGAHRRLAADVRARHAAANRTFSGLDVCRGPRPARAHALVAEFAATAGAAFRRAPRGAGRPGAGGAGRQPRAGGAGGRRGSARRRRLRACSSSVCCGGCTTTRRSESAAKPPAS